MTDNEIVNEFINDTTLTGTDLLLKEQVLGLDGAIKKNRAEQTKVVQNLQDMDSQYLKLSGALDSAIQLIVKARKKPE